MTEKQELALILAPLLKKERELAALKAQVEEEIRSYRDLIREEMERLDFDRFENDSLTATLVRPKPAQRLDKGKLIAAGVTPKQLEVGTIITERAPYLNIRPKTGDDE